MMKLIHKISISLILFVSLSPYALAGTQTFNDPALNGTPANTFTVPDGVVSVIVSMSGGGAGGGGWGTNAPKDGEVTYFGVILTALGGHFGKSPSPGVGGAGGAAGGVGGVAGDDGLFVAFAGNGGAGGGSLFGTGGGGFSSDVVAQNGSGYGGGGGGGWPYGGGGGGAQSFSGTLISVTPRQAIPVIVGAGGKGVSAINTLYSAGSGSQGFVTISWIDPGATNTSSNISSSWTITGPVTITGSGISESVASPPGTYTITWGNVDEYTAPASQSLTLVSSGTITFNGAYTPNTYTVSTSAGAGGSVSPASRTVSSGNTTTFTVTPNADYTASVTGCTGSLSGTTYTTGAITGACTVSATFTLTSCINGATVASSCTVCPTGQAYDGSSCVFCTGGCSGAGDINGNGASCINLASNPPFCSVCPIVGQDLSSGICANTVVLPVCGNTVCEVGETTTSCLADCKPKARFWQF